MKWPVLFLIVLLLGSCQTKVRQGPWTSATSRPQILDFGNISTADHHESINFISEDSQTIFFSRSDKEFKTSTLYSSAYNDGKWGKPEVLPFSGVHYDASLHFSQDKNTAFFTSNRDPNQEGLSREWNIWMATMHGDSWSEPQVLPPPLNSDSLECCLTLNSQGQAFFSSTRAGSWDIYQANYNAGTFTNIAILQEPINSDRGEWPGYISEDGTTLLFSSTRKPGIGGDDLYITRFENGKWSEPRLFPEPINSSSYDDNPRLIMNGKILVFSSWRDNPTSRGVSNIYYNRHTSE